ncbi:hypothetical protein FRC17_002521 [Serendipita sp. 399]|nr:hypothetical protein FRC17_002521 [Serendipita sp. 399]
MTRYSDDPPFPLPKNWNDELGGYYPSEEDERREREEQEEYLRSGYLNDPEGKFRIKSHWVGPQIDYPRHFTAEHWDPYENDVLLVRPEPPPPQPPFKRYIAMGLFVWALFHWFIEWRHRKKMAYRRERDRRMALGIPYWDKRDFTEAYADVRQRLREQENRWRIRHGYLPIWVDEDGRDYQLLAWDTHGRPLPDDPTPEQIKAEQKRVERLEKRAAWKKMLKETGQAYIVPGALEDLSDPEDFTPGFDDNPDYFDLDDGHVEPLVQQSVVQQERETTPQLPGAFPPEPPAPPVEFWPYPPYTPPSLYSRDVIVPPMQAAPSVQPTPTVPKAKPKSKKSQPGASNSVQAFTAQTQQNSTTSAARRSAPTPERQTPSKRRRTSHDGQSGADPVESSTAFDKNKRRSTERSRDAMVVDTEMTDQTSKYRHEEQPMEICDPERRGTKRTREEYQDSGMPESEAARKRSKKDGPALPVKTQTKSESTTTQRVVKARATQAVAKVQAPVEPEEEEEEEPMLAKDGITSTDPLCEGRTIGEVWLGPRWIYRVGMIGRRERLCEMICEAKIVEYFGQTNPKERIQCWLSEREYTNGQERGKMDSRTHFCHSVLPINDINQYCWANAVRILRPHPTRLKQKLDCPPPRPETPPPVVEPPLPPDPLAGILESLPGDGRRGRRTYYTHLPPSQSALRFSPSLIPGLYASTSPSHAPHTPSAKQPKTELPKVKKSAKSRTGSSEQLSKQKKTEQPKRSTSPIVFDDDIDDIIVIVKPVLPQDEDMEVEHETPIKATDETAQPMQPPPSSTPIAVTASVETSTSISTSDPPIVSLPPSSLTDEVSLPASSVDVAPRVVPKPKPKSSSRARLERISTQINAIPSKLSPSEALNEAIRKLSAKPARPSPLSQCITAEPDEPEPPVAVNVNPSPQTTDTSPTSSNPSDSTPALLSQPPSFVAPVTPSSSSASPQSPFDGGAPVLPSSSFGSFSSGSNDMMAPYTPAAQHPYDGSQTSSNQTNEPVIVNAVSSITEESSMMDIVMSPPPPSKVEYPQYTETSTFNHNPFYASFQSSPATPVQSPTQGLSGPPFGGFGNAPVNYLVAPTLNGSSTTSPTGFPASGYGPPPGTNGYWFASSPVLESPPAYTPTDAHYHPDPSRRPPPGTSHNNRVFKTYKRLQKSNPTPGQPITDGAQPFVDHSASFVQPPVQFHRETTGPTPTFAHFTQGLQQQQPQQHHQQRLHQQYPRTAWDPNQNFAMQM